MSGVLRVVFYRMLHLVSVPVPIAQVVGYAQENAAGQGRFGGTVAQVNAPGGVLGAQVWLWKGVRVGEGLTMDVWLIGHRRAPQTVLWRRGWWTLNLSAMGAAFGGRRDA